MAIADDASGTRLSRRSAWDREPSAFAETLRRARSGGRALLDLTESNPTRVALAYPDEAIATAYARAARAAYEPEPFGLVSAREAVARAYAPGVDPDRVLLTASTSEAYSHLFRLLADPGDVVLVPRPSYPLFRLLAELDGIEIASYRLDASDGWRPDWDSLEAAACGRPVRAVVIVSPNNPTGSSLDRGSIAALAERARERRWAIIADEVFCDYRDEGVSLVAARDAGLLGDVTWFALGGLSKSAGLPGAKLAWTVLGAGPSALGEIQARLEVIADTFLSPSMVVQTALPDLLALAPAIRARIQERLAANRDTLARSLAGSPVSALPVAGGWSAVLRVPRLRGDEDWAAELVMEDGVIVHPGSFFEFDSDGHLVVSLLPETAVFSEGSRRIVDRVRRACGETVGYTRAP